jgi:hypothetical protein
MFCRPPKRRPATNGGWVKKQAFPHGSGREGSALSFRFPCKLKAKICHFRLFGLIKLNFTDRAISIQFLGLFFDRSGKKQNLLF